MLWLQVGKTADGMIFGQNNPTLPRTIPMAYDRDATVLSMDPASILEHFALLPDPRREHGQIHHLDEIVFMAICGVLCGADSWQEIADYCESKLDWLSTFLALPGGVPSHDTFRRVSCLLDPLAFQACFFDWMTSLMARHGLTPIPLGRPELRPVAIDGKTQVSAQNNQSCTA
jgi:DDE_Tnp_1-associated